MSSEQRRILVVDDNEMNRDVLGRRLERQGFRVASADNGIRALEKLRAEAFDLILLDIMMPIMNGYQVLEALKADGLLRQIPVIVISAVDELDSVVKCIELGAEDYLFKPFNPVLLKARVSSILAKHPISREQIKLHIERIKHSASQLAAGEAADSHVQVIQQAADNILTLLG